MNASLHFLLFVLLLKSLEPFWFLLLCMWFAFPRLSGNLQDLLFPCILKRLYGVSWCGSIFIVRHTVTPFTMELYPVQFLEICNYFINEIMVFSSLSLMNFSWISLLTYAFHFFFNVFFSFCFPSMIFLLLYLPIYLFSFYSSTNFFLTLLFGGSCFYFINSNLSIIFYRY